MNPNVTPDSNLHAFDRWLASLGRNRVTGYRWKKQGLVNVVNILGHLYISADEIARFEERAMKGEFARDRTAPLRREIQAAA